MHLKPPEEFPVSPQSPSLVALLSCGKSHVKEAPDDQKVSPREDVLPCHIPGRKQQSSTSMTLKASEHLQRAGMWHHLQALMFITMHYSVHSAIAEGSLKHSEPLGRHFLHKR